MMKKIDQHVILITGASSGFGMLAALSLASCGCRIAAGVRDLDRGQKLLTLAEENGLRDRIQLYKLDVTQPEEVANAVQAAHAHYGRIDVLINNAGYAQGGFIEETPLSSIREQFDVNVFGMIHTTQQVLPIMRAQGRGTIINISSISGRFGFPGLGAYAASKFAMEGFSESLRYELMHIPIRVVLIEPGAYKTSIWEKSLAGVTSTQNGSAASPYAKQLEVLTRMVNQTAAQAGDPQEVIDTIIRAIFEEKPKLRYPVGRGVRIMLLLKALLPASWIEWSVRRRLR